jgi:hypothetical protein
MSLNVYNTFEYTSQIKLGAAEQIYVGIKVKLSAMLVGCDFELIFKIYLWSEY